MRAAGPGADGRTQRWEHRRPELLAAVTDYVLAHGVATLTLRPLAEAIGVTITTLIRQFGSKDELVEEVCRGIHRTTLHTLANDPELEGLTPTQTLDVLWARWLDPAQARQFVFLFELFGLALRDPERYEWFTSSVVEDWIKPVEDALVADGRSADEARILATVTLALLRGLHMDLAATKDRDRVDAAYRLAAAALMRDS
ncbi:TetR/AcrR family transcriptional regulator [Nocardia elegans]|uniref:TetR/AcrR family transcriptional regulator n=1 Tax=Nocardia elegans TaxID=300029 RepID=UPI0018960C06|nr:TetR/AcrR family transcriptional regulator [Nocardia elegans]